MQGYQKHHIVFRSQGGLDFTLNLIYLTPEEHIGDKGPHRNRERDLELKRNLQVTLLKLLTEDKYTLKEIIETLGLKRGQAEKAFKRVDCYDGAYKTEDIIRRLMGGKMY